MSTQADSPASSEMSRRFEALDYNSNLSTKQGLQSTINSPTPVQIEIEIKEETDPILPCVEKDTTTSSRQIRQVKALDAIDIPLKKVTKDPLLRIEEIETQLDEDYMMRICFWMVIQVITPWLPVMVLALPSITNNSTYESLFVGIWILSQYILELLAITRRSRVLATSGLLIMVINCMLLAAKEAVALHMYYKTYARSLEQYQFTNEIEIVGYVIGFVLQLHLTLKISVEILSLLKERSMAKKRGSEKMLLDKELNVF